jgi:uncharacterized membrane protein
MAAISQTYYNTLKFLHVLAAITWVGGNIYSQVLATRVIAAGDPVHLGRIAKDLGDLGNRLLLPAAVSVLVFGVWLVAVSAWNFTDPWILIGLTGVAITIVTGAFFIGPEAGRLGALAAERDPADPEIQRRIRRVVAISRIDLVVLVLVVADMVFKPGS